MPSINDNLNMLLENYFKAVENLESALVFDRSGLLIAKRAQGRLAGFLDRTRKETNHGDAYGALAGLIDNTFQRLKTYEIGSFGTTTIDTEDHRIIFTEAGPKAILLSVFPFDLEINRVLPYCFLIAEKVALIIEGKVSEFLTLNIPSLQVGFELGIDPSQIIQGPVKYDDNNVAKKVEMRYKLVVVGDSAVGKTSLINQFVTKSFTDDYRPTLGISITSQVYRIQGFDEAKINFMCWDIAGQKFFQRVRKHYYQRAQAAYIMYDVTNQESFDHVEDWYNDLHLEVPQVPTVLIGNKIDLDAGRVISTEDGITKAKRLKCSFLETSAKTGYNVRDAFHLLGIGLFFKADAKRM
jgi:small GTP-binding protein